MDSINSGNEVGEGEEMDRALQESRKMKGYVKETEL